MDKQKIKKLIPIAIALLLLFTAVFLLSGRENTSDTGPAGGEISEITGKPSESDAMVVPGDNKVTEGQTPSVTPAKKPAKAPKVTNTPAPSDGVKTPTPAVRDKKEYRFRNYTLLKQHYEKHGKDMGFPDSASYEAAASEVVNNPDALHKTEKEDGDDIYYIEKTNEFVVVAGDGYIRTYFLPDAGKKYYDRQ